MEKKYQVVIIGAGPGGYVAAIKAAQLGQSVLCVDKSKLGGVCLNWGCIPTKSLLRSAELYQSMLNAESFGIKTSGAEPDLAGMIDHAKSVSGKMLQGIEHLFAKNGVDFAQGTAKVVASNLVQITHHGEKTLVECEKVIVSTGALPGKVPFGQVDGKHVVTYYSALTLKEQPKRLAVVGAGIVGTEFAGFFNSIGSEVHLFETQEQILPGYDSDCSKVLAREFKKKKVKVNTKCEVTSVEVQADDTVKVTYTGKKGDESVVVDRVMIACGWRPNTNSLGLEIAGVRFDEDGYILVNEFQQTTNPNIYAVGDCTGHQLLAHKAAAEAEAAVDHICGNPVNQVDYRLIPSCIYSQPQLARVGLTEAKAVELGYEVNTGSFPFTASGLAQGMGHPEGLVKLVFENKHQRILGATIVGYNAVELIALLGLAVRLEATWAELGHLVFAHPTFAEAIMEAAKDSQGQAIHK